MKRTFGFYCPRCDRRLEAEEKSAGKNAVCPACRGEFTVPSIRKAGEEDFRRKIEASQAEKQAKRLELMLKSIKEREKKDEKPPPDEHDVLPPWLKKAVEGLEKEENPLNGIDLRDMGGKKRRQGKTDS